MNILKLFLSLLIVFMVSKNSESAEDCKLKFAPLPMESRETIIKQFKPLFHYLEETTGCTFEYDYSDNYAEILNKMKTGKVDLAYLGPLPYVSLKKEYESVEPLVFFKEASGEPKYTCCIVADMNNQVNLESIKNQKIALTQPLSTCGYLSTNGLMLEKNNNLKNNLFRYLDRHDDVALAVARGEFVAGGIKTAIANKYMHLGLKIISETELLPAFALVVNNTVNKENKNKIFEALIALDSNGKDHDRMESWGQSIKFGTTAATDQDYDAVRKLLLNEEIPFVGNF